jgi:hypothetical protein
VEQAAEAEGGVEAAGAALARVDTAGDSSGGQAYARQRKAAGMMAPDNGDLSDLAVALRDFLKLLRGRERAQTARRIARRLGVADNSPEKRIADAVRELRLVGYPVGSCGDGYFWLTDYDQAKKVYDRHVARGRAHFRTASMMRREFPALPPIEQTRLEV